MLAKRYKRCPSNRMLVIYGKVGAGTSAKCIHGGAAFVMPVIQDYAYLSLEPIQIEIPLRGALSVENIRVNVPSVFTVAIGTQPEVMQNAAIRLLGLNTQQIKQQAEDIIFGQLRQVIASMRIEDINRDREKFLQNIQHSLEPELKKIGLVLINVNITDITDESGYIDAIGQKAASPAIQQARGDVAEQEKIGRNPRRRGRARQGRPGRRRQQVEGDRHPRSEARAGGAIAELEKEQQVGEQTAAFEKEMQVAEADRAKRIAMADANAKAIAGEAKSQAEIAASQAELPVKQGRSLSARRNAEARSRSGRARSPEPGHGQGRPGRGRARRSRTPGRARSPRQGPEGQDDRRSRGRGREAAHRSRGRGRGDLRQARSRSPRPVRNPGQEGRRACGRSSAPAAARSRPSSC